jgi:hypothetical protein
VFRPPAPSVERESGHTDVVLRSDGHVLVVGNKVFALPDEEQPARHGAARWGGTVDDGISLVLSSPSDPGGPGNTYTTPSGRTWTWRSCLQLSAVLRSAFGGGAGAGGRRLRGRDATLERWMVSRRSDLRVDFQNI